MPIKPKDEENLVALFNKHKNTYGGRKEDYFAIQYLVSKFKVKIEDIAHQVSFGGNDYGVDAYFFDRETRNLYIYQFKWTEDHNQFKGAMDRLAKDGMSRIFLGLDQDPYHNEVISQLKRSMAEYKNLIERVYLAFVFKGDLNAVERSEGLNARREDIENKSYLITRYFGDRDVKFILEFLSDRPGLGVDPPNQAYQVRLISASKIRHDNKTMHLGFVSLMDLHAIHKGLGQKFFDRNIRSALPPDNAPNRKIRDALTEIVIKRTEEPSIFAFRHNGVTIAAERIVLEADRITLYTPRLLNGTQTISSVERFIEGNLDNPLYRANVDRLKSVLVVGKFIEDEPTSDFVANITISNNQQNPVPPWALRAMDKRQVDFADKFQSEVGIFYSRQEGAFENLSDEDRKDLGIDDAKDIKIRQLASTFLAIQGDIHSMSHIPEVFENYKIYDETFKNKYLQSSAKEIVLAYKVGMMLSQINILISEALPLKYHNAVSRSRSLTFALLLQALLNDKNYKSYVEDYGCDLIKSISFKEILKKIAKSKIAPLVREIVSSEEYKDRVAQGKFDFLRNSDVFKKAMSVARTRYGWSKQTF